MKNLAITVVAALLALSCVKNPSPEVDSDENFKDVIVNLTSTSVYSVPVKDGYTTVVTYKGQILAVTSKAMDIMVPKEAVQTKSDGDFTVYYKTGATNVSSSYLWQTIAFEDSKEGDFDYNDLVIHSKYERTDNNFLVSVHPIAFGATKSIKLGFEWHQGAASGREMVANDCRTELFGGKDGFINTLQYDVHYSDFVKEVSVTLPSSSEAVQIDWFIVVDGKVEIFAVNQSGYDCIDDDGMPYGFAITDAGNGAVNETKAAEPTTKATYSSWSEVMNLWQWPATPVASDYESLPDMENYKPWSAADGQNYYLRAGNVYSGEIRGVKNRFYVAGTLSVNNLNGCDIYVLAGGVLNVVGVSPIQNVRIYNFGGEVNFTSKKGKFADFGSGSVFMTAGDIEVDKLTVGGGAKVFIGDRATVKTLNMMNDNSMLYLGCCIYATESIYLTNESKMFIKHYINAPTMTIDSNSSIYLNGDEDGGCLVDITDLYTSSNKTATVSCIGNDYAVFNINHYFLNAYSHGDNEPFDISDRFLGKIDIHYQKANNNNHSWNSPNPNIQLIASNDVKINSNTYLPANGCHPAFGEQGGQGGGGETATGDTGLCWWKFPMERVNINTCYDFANWLSTGNFDFTLLPEAKVFDIFDEKPKDGEGRVYTL